MNDFIFDIQRFALSWEKTTGDNAKTWELKDGGNLVATLSTTAADVELSTRITSISTDGTITATGTLDVSELQIKFEDGKVTGNE